MKRHEYYCRKRLAVPAPPRKKSCISCIKAKTRCDSCRPDCGRCHKRTRKCVYPNDEHYNWQRAISLPSIESEPATECTATNPLLAPDLQPQFFSALEPTSLAPSRGLQAISLSSDMCSESEASASTRMQPSSSPSSPSTSYVPTGDRYKLDSSVTSQQITTPYSPGSHLLLPKKRKHAYIVHTDSFVCEVLRSYPRRVLRRSTCPPFIHLKSLQQPATGVNLEDSMFFNLDIAKRFAIQEAGSNSLIWDAIVSEQERIYDQRMSFNKWQLLSAAQALTMYLLTRVAQAENALKNHQEIDIALLFTLREIFGRLNEVSSNPALKSENADPRTSWEQWVFAESALRTATIYFILRIHFHIDFGLPCNRADDLRFEDLKLPAAKVLWEAQDEESWAEELGLLGRTQAEVVTEEHSEANLSIGDLVRFNKLSGDGDTPGKDEESGLRRRLDEWFEGIDELGMLISASGAVV